MKMSVDQRKKKNKDYMKKSNDKIPTVHTRAGGPTVQLCGDSTCKWINGDNSLEQKYRGKVGQAQRILHSRWKRKIAGPISKTNNFVKHVYREHKGKQTIGPTLADKDKGKIVIVIILKCERR